MEAIGNIEIPVKALDEPFRLYPFADIHWGNKGCSKNTLRENIAKAAEDRNSRAILIGDQIDAISTKDKRFDPDVADPDVMSISDLGCLGPALCEGVAEEFKPLKGRILAAVYGNHEFVYMRSNEHADMHAIFCKSVGALNLGFSGMVNLVFTSGRAKAKMHLFVHHGSGAAATSGGKINRLDRFTQMTMADLILVGHVHEMMAHPYTRLGTDPECKHIVDYVQTGVICGTFLRTYARGVVGYGEIRGYSPTSIGSPCIEIVPSTRAIGVNWMRG